MNARDVTEHELSQTPGKDDRPGHLGFVAHEIRNPLSTALWTAELLARMPSGDRGGARGEKLSSMCLRSIARVRQLVEDHFLCERLDAGGLPLRIEALGARETVDGVIERRPPDSGTASVEVDPALGIEADRGLLERALDALVAVAGADRAPVRVTTAVAEDTISFEVSGRPPDPGAIQDPVKGSPSDHTGRALALPLARRIAEALSGKLTVGEVGWCLTVRRARGYTPRPKSPANP